jgi:4-hydroxy-tetrahydrodipicolinate reductase
VIQAGFGSLGRHIAEAMLKRENLELVAIMDANPKLKGKKLNDLLPHAPKSSLKISDDMETALKTNPAHVAVVATSSSLAEVAPMIKMCLGAGLDVVSICEELSYPYGKNPEVAVDLDKAAQDAGKTVVGTGINPGYLMDLLPIVLTAPCQTVNSIRVTRHMNSSHRRPSFQKKIGTGMTVDTFRKMIDEGKITGHVGLVESIQMIEEALNLDLDEVKELPPEPIVAKNKVTNSFTTIKKGEVLGLQSIAVGRKKDEQIVTLDFQAYAEARPQYDEIVIDGVPPIRQRVEGGVQGDQGTIGMILNLIPIVVSESPGLKTMKDLPVPRNTERYR